MAVNIGDAPAWVLSLVMIGVFAVAGIIAVETLGNTSIVSNNTQAQNTITQVLSGIGGVTTMLGAIGIMIGVGILITVLIRAFGGEGNKGA